MTLADHRVTTPLPEEDTMDVELTKDGWVLRTPVAPNYTVQEAGLILCMSTTWVRVCEALYGPASTDAHPVDHDALVRFVRTRAQKHRRAAARGQLRRILVQHLED